MSFLNWGAHKATNKYAHIPNVVLAGTLFYRTSQYEARKRLGAGLTPDYPNISDNEMKKFEIGESANDVLQAACRGAIRLSLGNTCPPSRLYLITAPAKGIEKALPRIFPDGKMKPWSPGKTQSERKLREGFQNPITLEKEGQSRRRPDVQRTCSSTRHQLEAAEGYCTKGH